LCSINISEFPSVPSPLLLLALLVTHPILHVSKTRVNVRKQAPQTYIKRRLKTCGNKKPLPKFPLFCTNINYTVLINSLFLLNANAET
jgi:hypothetical protein